MRRSTGSIGRWLLAAGALALALGAVELVLRVTMPAPGGFLRGLHEARPDRSWLYGLRPGAEVTGLIDGPVRYAINAAGFRGPRRTRSKPEGVFRLVVIGDSLAFGYGVAEDEAFPAVLERLLAERAGGRVIEVLNLGVNGYNPYTEAKLLADVGMTYEPDLVLVQFCVNDLNDPTLHFDASTQVSLGKLPEEAFPDPSARRPPPGWAERVCRRLDVCRLLQVVRQQWFPDPEVGALLARTLAPRDGTGPELPWLRARYAEMAGTAAARGTRFAIAVFPPLGEVDGPPAPGMAERVVALCAAEGWRAVDLLPALRAAARAGGPRLFLDPWHPTAAGHRVAAEALARALTCGGLVPTTTRTDCAGGSPARQ